MTDLMTLKTSVALLSALAQETRLSLFRLLIKQGPEGMSAGDIARQLAVPNSTLSYHLNGLEQAGLITAHKDQRQIIYAVDLQRLDRFLSFLIRDCCQGAADPCFTFLNSAPEKNES